MKRLSILFLLCGCGVEPTEPPREPLPVPFAVSDYYSPTGFFGDGETRDRLQVTRGCPARAAGAQGDCYTVTYHPGTKGFAGVFWQHPHNNWGQRPGYSVAAGATRVTFQARGAKGGEAVTFGAGQKDTPNPHNDAFQLEGLTAPLTPDFRPYEVPFQGTGYQGPSGVIGAFVISLAAGDTDDPIVLHVDDIRWQR